MPALAIHPTTGDVYVAGWTYSTDFPNTTGGAQASFGGGFDAFVARLNSNLTQILQSTYLGGSGSDWAYALAIHPTTGDVYVAGSTDSTNFPNTTGGAQASFGGGTDAFVARLTADLAAGSYTPIHQPNAHKRDCYIKPFGYKLWLWWFCMLCKTFFWKQ
jgi:hypothetical protein